MDADSGLVHTVTTTSANEHDITQTHALRHGEAHDVFGDAGYTGVEKRDELKNLDAQWHVAMKPSQKNAIQDKRLREIVDRLEFLKSSVRARVEHAFRVVKRWRYFADRAMMFLNPLTRRATALGARLENASSDSTSYRL